VLPYQSMQIVIVAQVVSTCGVLSSNPILNIYNKLLKTIFLLITGKKKKKKKKLKHVPPLSTSIRESAGAERASKKNWLLAHSEKLCRPLPTGSNTTCA